MKSDNSLLIVAVIAVVVSIFATGFTYFSIANLAEQITGYATGATANLTVETLAQINFTNFSIAWGSGRVNPGATAASLITTAAGTVTNGNWTADDGLILENSGNVNVSLNLTGDKTAAAFIGGTGPAYLWNITNVEANSCINATGGLGGPVLDLNTFHNVNTSQGLSRVCNTFGFKASADTIRIDFNVTVPEDSSTGALTDLINATAYT